MAIICIVLEDHPGGKVDIQVHAEGIIEGDPVTVSQKMAVTMLEAAKAMKGDESDVTDSEVRH